MEGGFVFDGEFEFLELCAVDVMKGRGREGGREDRSLASHCRTETKVVDGFPLVKGPWVILEKKVGRGVYSALDQFLLDFYIH